MRDPRLVDVGGIGELTLREHTLDPPLRAHRHTRTRGQAQRCVDHEDHDLVVAKENGEPIHPHPLSQSFERLLEKYGLRRIRLHDLRHTHATLAPTAGVPVKVISERLGHESPAFTLKQYAHVVPACRPRLPPRSPRRSMVRLGPFDFRLTRRRNDESPGSPGLSFYRDFQLFRE